MSYIVDRQRALRTDDIVAVIKTQQRRLRSRVILRDNSLYQTLTRPQTLVRYTEGRSSAIAGVRVARPEQATQGEGRRAANERGKGAARRKQRGAHPPSASRRLAESEEKGFVT
jgi:hypothetical protein